MLDFQALAARRIRLAVNIVFGAKSVIVGTNDVTLRRAVADAMQVAGKLRAGVGPLLKTHGPPCPSDRFDTNLSKNNSFWF